MLVDTNFKKKKKDETSKKKRKERKKEKKNKSLWICLELSSPTDIRVLLL